MTNRFFQRTRTRSSFGGSVHLFRMQPAHEAFSEISYFSFFLLRLHTHTCGSLSSLRGQGVKIVAALFEQAVFNYLLAREEDLLAPFGVIAARLEKLMKIERLFIESLELAQDLSGHLVYETSL